jgi:uncharacterized protein YPO0396
MDMSELNLFPDTTLSGYRLHHLEVYNWGTFHKEISTLELGGRSCLLTGDIGSGKSTLVDALTTLLFPSHKVAYNKAAGAESRERNLKSYVMGHYKSEREELGVRATPVALRDRNSYSVLLGVFENQTRNEVITLAQVFWNRESGEQPERFYAGSLKRLSIAADFSNFGTGIDKLKKRLRQQEVELFESFPKYGAWFRKSLNIKSEQALDLFHQTVSMKSVGNLTDFVRQHMLEPAEAETRIENLVEHYEHLTLTYEAIRKARQQVELLKPLVEDSHSLKKLEGETEGNRSCREALGAWFTLQKQDLLQELIFQLEQDFQRLTERLNQWTLENREQDHREQALREAILNEGGARLQQLRREIETKQQELRRREERYSSYEQLIQKLDQAPARSEDEFQRQLAELEQARKQNQEQLEHAEEEQVEYQMEQTREEQEFKRLREEVEGLRARKSNIDEKQIQLRRRMCQELGLHEEELPFAGELIQVRESEADWEGAIERLLHGLGLSMLVPPHHYRQVADWVDQQHLKGRLVYFKTGASARRESADTRRGSLLEKLELKPNAPGTPWLREYLHRSFDLVCCETTDQFRQEPQAITRAGQIKRSGGRHEKDDRYSIRDRSRYVLGWDNSSKIRDLEQRIQKAAEKIQEWRQLMEELRERRQSAQNRRDALSRLQEYQSFRELDRRPLDDEISALRRNCSELEASSNQLQTLQKEQQALRLQREQHQEAGDALKKDRSQKELQLSNAQENLNRTKQDLASEPEPSEELMQRLRQLQAEHLGETPLGLNNLESSERRIRARLQSEIDTQGKQATTLRDRIIRMMTEYKEQWPQESREVDANLESAAEFEEMLNRLRHDDLPRFEKEFQDKLRKNTLTEVVSFNSWLDLERKKVDRRVRRINQSLNPIDYNPGRYIQLEAEPTQDPEIREFQKDLRGCSEEALMDSGTLDYVEEKFLQVRKLIERFQGRSSRIEEDRRWTRKVTDVRNWFTFAASERWRVDDHEHEHYTDSGGKSGGQKEKLAYTILAASLAYQFGLEWGEEHAQGFRFVVIDEAFGRGSEESAEYGLELFSKLGLQLLVVTPLQKIRTIEPYVSHVGFVSIEDGQRSQLINLGIEEYQEQRAQWGT